MLPSAGIAVALYSVAAGQQEAFHTADPWEETLTEVLGNSPGSCGRMMRGGSSGVPTDRRTQDLNARLDTVMRRIGFDRVTLRFGRPSPEWCYVRGDETQWGKRINVSGSLVAEVSGDKAKQEVAEEADIPF